MIKYTIINIVVDYQNFQRTFYIEYLYTSQCFPEKRGDVLDVIDMMDKDDSLLSFSRYLATL